MLAASTCHQLSTNACCPVQEACALRFLQARNTASHAGLIQLSSAFTHCGHVCLVLERLHGSLLDYVVHSACLPQPKALQNLRKVAVQLLVCSLVQCTWWHDSHADPNPTPLSATPPPPNPLPGSPSLMSPCAPPAKAKCSAPGNGLLPSVACRCLDDCHHDSDGNCCAAV